MGWCAEFACNINPSCEHRMTAGTKSCSCEACGVVCAGRYSGCKEVWAAGPRRSRGTRPPMPGRSGGVKRAAPAAEMAPAPEPPPLPLPLSPTVIDARAFTEVQTSVAEMQQRLDVVLTMLSQQQAILAMLVQRRIEEPPPTPTVFQPPNRRPSAIELAVDALLPPSTPAE